MTFCAPEPATTDRRRLFWATQPAACGEERICQDDCGRPGLEFSDECEQRPCNNVNFGCDDGCPDYDCDNLGIAGCEDAADIASTYRSLRADNWVQGLILNMLGTSGHRPETDCGYRPGGRAGHWSQSFITDGSSEVGTLMLSDLTNSSLTIANTVALIRSNANATLARLITRGVAQSVDVEAEYAGSGRVRLTVVVFGRNGEQTRVGLIGERSSSAWIWANDQRN